MLVDFTGSLSSLTQEPTHSLSTLHLNKVIVAVIVVDFLIVFVIFRLQVSLADGGNYSCQPASLPRASTTLHVLKVIIVIFILMAIDWYCCPDGEETEDSGEAFDNQWSSRPDLDQDQRISSHCFTSLSFHMINMWS